VKNLKLNYKIAGDQSILIEIGEKIDKKVNDFIRGLADVIERDNCEGIGEVILGYNTLLVHYNPLVLSYKQLEKTIDEYAMKVNLKNNSNDRIVEIPVLYGEQWGPDIGNVAKTNNVTEDEVIEIHTSATYLVYFLGFSPGFPFLSGMPKEIATPRLSNPRIKVAAGSVGIANNQTGIYPIESPGGWQLIGHTPVLLYDPKKEWPFLLKAGDTVKFKSVSKEEYYKIKSQIDNNTYDLVNLIK